MSDTDDVTTATVTPADNHSSTVAEKKDPMAISAETKPCDVPVELLEQFAELCYSPNMEAVHHGTLMIRKLVSVEDVVPRDEVIATNVCAKLAEFLKHDSDTELQFQAAWALTNMASGEQRHTSYVVSLNTIPSFVKLLTSKDVQCRDQATWAVGNIGGDRVYNRDLLLAEGGLTKLLALAQNESESDEMRENALWAATGLFRLEPAPGNHYVQEFLPVAEAEAFCGEPLREAEASWAVVYLAATRECRPLLTHLLGPLVKRVDPSTHAPTANAVTHVLGRFAAGSEADAMAVIEVLDLDQLLTVMLGFRRFSVRQASCNLLCALFKHPAAAQSLFEGLNSTKTDASVEKVLAALLAMLMKVDRPSDRSQGVWAVQAFLVQCVALADSTSSQFGFLQDPAQLACLCSDAGLDSSMTELVTLLVEHKGDIDAIPLAQHAFFADRPLGDYHPLLRPPCLRRHIAESLIPLDLVEQCDKFLPCTVKLENPEVPAL